MHVLSERLFRARPVAPPANISSVCAGIAAAMMKEGREGSLVSLICDSGDRYAATYYNQEWLADNRIDINPYKAMVEAFIDTGDFSSFDAVRLS